MKITALIGLPGSGKSHYLFKFKNNPDYIIIDDPKSKDELPENTDKNIIIADCHLCIPSIRIQFEKIIKDKYPNHLIELVFFENNPEMCHKNSNYRNDGRVVNLTINEYSKKYVIPEGYNILPVYDTDKIKSKIKFGNF